jgi:GNAT superfamily N-acetyltransferase
VDEEAGHPEGIGMKTELSTQDKIAACVAEILRLGPLFRGDDEVLIGKTAVTVHPKPFYLYIKGLKSSPANQGHGTAAMNKIVELADKHGVILGLYPHPLDEPESIEAINATVKRLIAFYKRFGFQGTKEAMLRHPKKPQNQET